MNRTVRGASVAALLLVPVVAPVAAPASAYADDARLELSRDGIHWHDGLAAPLFPADVRWVPGDVRTSRFYIRNLSVDAGRLSVAVRRTRPEEDLVDSDAMLVEARTGSGPWRVVDTGSTESHVDLEQVATQRVVSVDVRARMRSGAPNGTMRLGSQLALDVTLTDAVAGDEPTGAGSLPSTGSDVPPWLPPSALAMLGLGVYLVRRRRDDEVFTGS